MFGLIDFQCVLAIFISLVVHIVIFLIVFFHNRYTIHDFSCSHLIFKLLLSFSITCILSITLLPVYPGMRAEGDAFNLIPFASIGTLGHSLKNTIGNILLFVPFGLFFALSKQKSPLWMCIILAIILSVAIELIQFVETSCDLAFRRTADIDDVFLNIIGGIGGYLISKIIIIKINNKKY